MTVKELKDFLDYCPDDLEVKYETEMGVEPVKKALIKITSCVFNDKTQERELQLTEPFVYLY